MVDANLRSPRLGYSFPIGINDTLDACRSETSEPSCLLVSVCVSSGSPGREIAAVLQLNQPSSQARSECGLSLHATRGGLQLIKRVEPSMSMPVDAVCSLLWSDVGLSHAQYKLHSLSLTRRAEQQRVTRALPPPNPSSPGTKKGGARPRGKNSLSLSFSLSLSALPNHVFWRVLH